MDFVKIIENYPRKGNIVTIESQKTGLGGCSHNVLVDLARMQTGLPLYAGGCIGDDENGRYILSQLKLHGIDANGMAVVPDVPTSYTDVMTEKHGGARTFFHCRGANARFGVEHIAAMHNPARIFHLGYLLLLDRLDCPDESTVWWQPGRSTCSERRDTRLPSIWFPKRETGFERCSYLV